MFVPALLALQALPRLESDGSLLSLLLFREKGTKNERSLFTLEAVGNARYCK